MGSLADTDVVPLARRRLLTSTKVTQVLGGQGRVGPTNEPPYPRIRLTDPPGDDRGLTHLIAPLLQIEVLGDPAMTGQKPLLRKILYTALEEMASLPEEQATGDFDHVEGEPWVTAVLSTGGGGFVPEPTGQPRYMATLRLYVHP